MNHITHIRPCSAELKVLHKELVKIDANVRDARIAMLEKLESMSTSFRQYVLDNYDYSIDPYFRYLTAIPWEHCFADEVEECIALFKALPKKDPLKLVRGMPDINRAMYLEAITESNHSPKVKAGLLYDLLVNEVGGFKGKTLRGVVGSTINNSGNLVKAMGAEPCSGEYKVDCVSSACSGKINVKFINTLRVAEAKCGKCSFDYRELFQGRSNVDRFVVVSNVVTKALIHDGVLGGDCSLPDSKGVAEIKAKATKWRKRIVGRALDSSGSARTVGMNGFVIKRLTIDEMDLKFLSNGRFKVKAKHPNEIIKAYRVLYTELSHLKNAEGEFRTFEHVGRRPVGRISKTISTMTTTLLREIGAYRVAENPVSYADRTFCNGLESMSIEETAQGGIARILFGEGTPDGEWASQLAPSYLHYINLGALKSIELHFKNPEYRARIVK